MKWKSEKQADQILRIISSSREIKEDGSVAYHSLRAEYGWPSILFTIVIDATVSDTLKMAAIKSAAQSSQELSRKHFQRAYNKYVSEARERKSRYLVAFPVWGRTELFSSRRTIDSVDLTLKVDPDSRTTRTILKERTNQRKTFADSFDQPLDYLSDVPVVACRVSAISSYEAFELASNALYQYLGALTFFDNWGRWSIVFEGRQPINQLLVAPQISVHTSRGRLVFQNFWYHDWSRKPMTPHSGKPERDQVIRSLASKVLSSMVSLPWSDQAKRALRLYYEAFSDHNHENSFLAGWRILELVGGDGQTRAETLVERAAKCFADYESAMLIGHHLRERRNAMTHFGSPHIYDGRELSQQMNDFLSPLMKMYLLNGSRFRKESELWQFLDLDPDPVQRDRLAFVLRRADKFHGRHMKILEQQG